MHLTSSTLKQSNILGEETYNWQQFWCRCHNVEGRGCLNIRQWDHSQCFLSMIWLIYICLSWAREAHCSQFWWIYVNEMDRILGVRLIWAVTHRQMDHKQPSTNLPCLQLCKCFRPNILSFAAGLPKSAESKLIKNKKKKLHRLKMSISRSET